MELEVVTIKIIDDRFVLDYGEPAIQLRNQLEPIEDNSFHAIVFAEQETTEKICLWMVMRHDDNFIVGVLTVPVEKMESWSEYKKHLKKNHLSLETINTIFLMDENGNVVATMVQLARNEMLLLVKEAYAQVEHLLNVPAKENA